MSERMESKLDEVLGSIGSLNTHIEHQNKTLDEIKSDLIPNGTKRINDLEKDVKDNSKFRYIITAVASGIASIAGWLSATFKGGGAL